MSIHTSTYACPYACPFTCPYPCIRMLPNARGHNAAGVDDGERALGGWVHGKTEGALSRISCHVVTQVVLIVGICREWHAQIMTGTGKKTGKRRRMLSRKWTGHKPQAAELAAERNAYMHRPNMVCRGNQFCRCQPHNNGL